MSLRPLLLAAMTIALSTGCANKPASSPSEPSNEPGTPVAPAPAPQAAQPPSEPGSGGTAPAPEAAQGTQQPQAGAAAAQPTVYKVKISGVRCIAAPCPTHKATPVNDTTGEYIHIHEIDFSGANVPQERIEALNRRMEQGEITVEATIGTRPHAGPAGAATVLKVSKVIDPKP